MFTEDKLRKLIIPLIIEQFLAVAMGMADTFMVSSCGEAAVSGISLVDTICILMFGLFTAMSSGGSVVVAQYMGKKDRDMVGKASNQLFLAVGSFSVLFMVIGLLGNNALLGFIYGNLEPEVMEAARIYFFYSALAFPVIGLYNGAAALFRSIGNSKLPMKVSMSCNLLNVVGNALLIYGFNMGVTGAAISTFVARVVAAIAIMGALIKSDELVLNKSWKLDWGVMKKILYIGVPNGIESSIFQVGKLILSSLIASFGTAAITANAVVNSVGSLQLVPSNAMGIGIITVVGQCIGAKETEAAKKYLFKMLRMTQLMMVILGVPLFLFARPVFGLYHLSEETMEIAIQLQIFNCFASIIAQPYAFPLANGLRAANDVRYTMVVSIITMFTCRIALAYVLGDFCGLGVLGVWIAMSIDWVVRAIFFIGRVRTGKWLRYMNKITETA
ncbi:MAG: MATE family efflux transporter [Lachnospiraceae bacterium]|nr:MATE family efflux transporter [Lachnospiraceae bacterium]